MSEENGGGEPQEQSKRAYKPDAAMEAAVDAMKRSRKPEGLTRDEIDAAVAKAAESNPDIKLGKNDFPTSGRINGVRRAGHVVNGYRIVKATREDGSEIRGHYTVVKAEAEVAA